jgi:hypothetical protein
MQKVLTHLERNWENYVIKRIMSLFNEQIPDLKAYL